MITRIVVRRQSHKVLPPCLKCLRSLTTTVENPQAQNLEPFHQGLDKPNGSTTSRSLDRVGSSAVKDVTKKQPRPKLLESAMKGAKSKKRKPRGRLSQRDVLIGDLQKKADRNAKGMGTIVEAEAYYEPHRLIDNPPAAKDITLELLLASQSHMGHATSRWNPQNQKFIFGIREGIHIISLEVTAAYLRRAAKVVEGVAYHGGLILFAGLAKHGPALLHAANSSGSLYLHQPWQPGSITNRGQMMANLELKTIGPHDQKLGGYDDLMQEISKPIPDLVIVANSTMQYTLLHECGLNNIPTIGIIDTDADPSWVTYPIPANDDSLRCCNLIIGVLGRAAAHGRRLRLRAAKSGLVTWETHPSLTLPPEEFKSNDDKNEKPKLRVQPNPKATVAQSELPAQWRQYKDSLDVDVNVRPVGGPHGGIPEVKEIKEQFARIDSGKPIKRSKEETAVVDYFMRRKKRKERDAAKARGEVFEDDADDADQQDDEDDDDDDDYDDGDEDEEDEEDEEDDEDDEEEDIREGERSHQPRRW